MAQYYEASQCSECGRPMRRRWLPPTSNHVDCACGAKRRLDPKEFVNAWGRWSAWAGWILGTVATLVVMIAVAPATTPRPVYLLASLGAGSVAAVVSWFVGRFVGLIVGILKGVVTGP